MSARLAGKVAEGSCLKPLLRKGCWRFAPPLSIWFVCALLVLATPLNFEARRATGHGASASAVSTALGVCAWGALTSTRTEVMWPKVDRGGWRIFFFGLHLYCIHSCHSCSCHAAAGLLAIICSFAALVAAEIAGQVGCNGHAMLIGLPLQVVEQSQKPLQANACQWAWWCSMWTTWKLSVVQL